MLIPDSIHPENSIYYLGADVIECLQEQGEMKLLDLYENLIEKKEISFPVLLLIVDWLFLINIVDVKNNGIIYLCT
jgi:hypothetical protein